MIGAWIDSLPVIVKALVCLPCMIAFWLACMLVIGAMAPGPKAEE
jgi:hypothetical protein